MKTTEESLLMDILKYIIVKSGVPASEVVPILEEMTSDLKDGEDND